MKRGICLFANSVDKLFITFKILFIFCVLYYCIWYTSWFSHLYYKYIIPPFLLYSIINTIRLFDNRKRYLILIELMFNIIFVWYYGTGQLIYMSLSFLSLIIVEFLNIMAPLK